MFLRATVSDPIASRPAVVVMDDVSVCPCTNNLALVGVASHCCHGEVSVEWEHKLLVGVVCLEYGIYGIQPKRHTACDNCKVASDGNWSVSYMYMKVTGRAHVICKALSNGGQLATNNGTHTLPHSGKWCSLDVLPDQQWVF